MQRLPTPAYHLTSEEKQNVYEPSEDSFLLLDALEMEFDYIKKCQPVVCVEIGCGSGIISSFVSKNFSSTWPEGSKAEVPVVMISTDVNPTALTVAYRTAALNGTPVHCIGTDLVDALKHRLNGNCNEGQRFSGLVDLLLFNPPYVPTKDVYENSKNYIAHAYDGGVTGTETLDRLFPQVFNLLSASGIFYLVALSSNDIDRLLKLDNRLTSSIVLKRKCGIERLYVLKFVKKFCAS